MVMTATKDRVAMVATTTSVEGVAMEMTTTRVQVALEEITTRPGKITRVEEETSLASRVSHQPTSSNLIQVAMGAEV